MEKIGVFICECGPNIKDALHLDQLVNFANDLDEVHLAKVFGLLCSVDGRQALIKEIQDNGLTRVVIAACSPKEHEKTFKKLLEDAGLNPYLLQIANIREHCAWVIKDKDRATKKAKSSLLAAVKRVSLQEPLETKQIDANPDVLVLGAGMAGIGAALSLASRNRKVYLVEKMPCIGGRVARYEEVYPNLECASCMLDPKLDEVLHHDNIELLRYSDLDEVLGFYGDFIAKVTKNATSVDDASCIGCSACVEACPVEVENEYSEGMDKRKAVYIPYPGSLPNLAVIDRKHCLRFRDDDKRDESCDKCQKSCPFGSIDYSKQDESIEVNVGAIIAATGFSTFDPKRAPKYAYGDGDDVYTSLEFERILSSTGPTEGKILKKDGTEPKKIAIVHCVGSRTKEFNEYCSGICCMYSIKFAHLIRSKIADSEVTMFYSDLCLPGKGSQEFFNRVISEDGVKLVRMQAPDSIEIENKGSDIRIKCRDPRGKKQKGKFDMVVLATAVEPSDDTEALSEILEVSPGKDGFFTEEHSTLAPTSTAMEGIFIAGCDQGPKDIPSSVAQGQSAAGSVLVRLIPGEKLTLEAMTAEIDEDLCSGCKTCIGMCPYKAIYFDEEEKHAKINEVLCRGCGACVAACPSGVIKAKHFTDEQIMAEIGGLLG